MEDDMARYYDVAMDGQYAMLMWNHVSKIPSHKKGHLRTIKDNISLID